MHLTTSDVAPSDNNSTTARAVAGASTSAAARPSEDVGDSTASGADDSLLMLPQQAGLLTLHDASGVAGQNEPMQVDRVLGLGSAHLSGLIEDVDAADRDDPQQAAEYVREIFSCVGGASVVAFMGGRSVLRDLVRACDTSAYDVL